MIDILQMIKQVMLEKHMSKAELSRKMGLHYSTVQGMLSRNTIQVKKLGDLCEILDYNFFREIAEQIPIKNSELSADFKTKAELSEEINRLKEENKSLKAKIEVLKEVIG